MPTGKGVAYAIPLISVICCTFCHASASFSVTLMIDLISGTIAAASPTSANSCTSHKASGTWIKSVAGAYGARLVDADDLVLVLFINPSILF